MITISIIITFYDKDYHNIPNMLIHLSKLTFNKEVIFVDDRNDKSIDIRKEYNVPNEYLIINSYPDGSNVGPFEARRTGTLNATGDYIWFVDVDDQPLDIKIDERNLKDLYIFTLLCFYTDEYKFTLMTSAIIFDKVYKKNNTFSCKNSIINFNITDSIKNIKIVYHFFDKYVAETFLINLCNKLFKTSIMKSVFNSVEIIKHLDLGEDAFLSFLYFDYLIKQNNFTIQFKNNPPNYVYNVEGNKYSSHWYINNDEGIKRKKKTQKMFKKYLSNEYIYNSYKHLTLSK